jgi:hypothetical protein
MRLCCIVCCYRITSVLIHHFSRNPILRLDRASLQKIPQMKANAYTQTKVTETRLTPSPNIFAICQPDLTRLLQRATPCQATVRLQ